MIAVLPRVVVVIPESEASIVNVPVSVSAVVCENVRLAVFVKSL